MIELFFKLDFIFWTNTKPSCPYLNLVEFSIVRLNCCHEPCDTVQEHLNRVIFSIARLNRCCEPSPTKLLIQFYLWQNRIPVLTQTKQVFCTRDWTISMTSSMHIIMGIKNSLLLKKLVWHNLNNILHQTRMLPCTNRRKKCA